MSRRLLAIESATDWLSIALFEEDELVRLACAEGTRQHAAALLPTIEQALSDTGWSVSQLDRLAVSAGPGSFTSLRIGLATAKGLAFGREWSAVGVSTLETIAAAASDAEGFDPEGPVLSLLDARRGEWYAGAFRRPGTSEVSPAMPEGLYTPEALAADLAEPVVVACPDRAEWQADLEAAGVRIARVIPAEAARPRADRAGRIGLRFFEAGLGEAVEALSARYLRRAEAEAKRLGGPVERGELARGTGPSG